MVKIVVGSNVEDLQTAILILPHYELFRAAGQGMFPGPSAAASSNLPIVIDDVICTDVENRQAAIRIPQYSYLQRAAA